MILLVVGLVAVIVVILIAVFLSIRLGGGDEHEDESDIRPSSRDQRAEEDRWLEPASRDGRRSPQTARTAGRGAGERHSSRDDDGRRSGEPAYSGARERGPAQRAGDMGYRADDMDYAEPRRPTHRDASEYESSPARRRSAPASADSRGRHDEVPARRAAADDFPSADYPSMDFASGEYPAQDYPSRDSREYAADDYPPEELPTAPVRSAKRSAAQPRPDADRPDSRRKAASAPASGKSRSRQHRGKRDDTDDWPSSEWDKLSDEQYWAELSADKPLATMGKPGKPAGNAEPATVNPSREEHESRASRTVGATQADPDELSRARLTSPYREEGRGQRDRPHYEAATERLPVRSRQQPPVPAARPAAEAPASHPVPAGTHPSLDTGRYSGPGAARHPSLDTGFPVAGTTGAYPVPDTGPLPTRDLGRHPSLDTGPLPTRDLGRHPSLDTGFPAATDTGRHPPLDSGRAGTPPPPVPGALEDDPLTSPSFSLTTGPARDSRSYGQARKASNAAASTGNGSGPSASNGARHAGRHASGSYPAANYASPAYTYPAEPAPAPAAPAPPAEWYSSPPEPAPTPAYGNPYSYPEASTAGSPASAAGDPGYGGHLADPLRAHPIPPYQSPASATVYPDPYPAVPAQGMGAPAIGPAGDAGYSQAYPEHPHGQGRGQLDPPPYPDASGGPGYAPRYNGGYDSDPYAAGGYSPYPPQG